MKKLFISLLIIASTGSFAQITLENSYPNSYLQLVKLSTSGYKYVDYNTSTITFYNLNHTIFRTITIPSAPGGYNNSFVISYISEELFNTNPADIEYLLYYTQLSTSSFGHIRVYNDAGSILFSIDSTNGFISNSVFGFQNQVSYTTSGWKMIVPQAYNPSPNRYSVYSLPGTLPCQDCSNSVVSSMVTNPNGGTAESKVSNYPNPAIGQTTIEYQLPQGITTADLVFYNIAGQEVKRYKVSSAFTDIIITTAELEAGTYYYQLQTTSGFKAGKKMVVIK